MRIWGYVLIFLNAASAGAFVYFAMSVMKARSEWQYALLKQELTNRGLPIDPTPPEDAPYDLDNDSIPFRFQYDGAKELRQINKEKLKKLIPAGGDVLGTKEAVASQTDEVKRVEKIVFAALDGLKGTDKQQRQMILLLNLARGKAERSGVYALLRDLKIEKRRDAARREMAYLGRSAPQTSALFALAAVGDTHLAYGPNIPPADKQLRIRAGRKALITWAFSEVPYVAPDALPPTIPPPPTDVPAGPEVNADRDALLEALKALQIEVDADMPDAAKVEDGKKRVLGLLEGDTKLKSDTAAILIPFIAEIATNLLNTEKDVADAKVKLVELLQLRSISEAEKEAMTAIADVMVPPAPTGEQTEATLADKNIDVVATKLLRTYFEEALAKPSTDKLADDFAKARIDLSMLKPVRDPGEQRRSIAHLLYHMDAHLGPNVDSRSMWYKAFIAPELGKEGVPEPAADGKFKMRSADEDLLKNRSSWHLRVAAIVGLENYVPTVEAQASELSKMVQRLQDDLVKEQGYFESEYQAVVLQALFLAGQVDIRQAEILEQKLLLDTHKNQVAIRTGERNALKTDLDNAAATAKTALEKLAVRVDELFAITKELGEAQDALLGLELRLRDLEFSRKDKK